MNTTRLRSTAARALAMSGCAAALVLINSCDSFLDPKPTDVLAPENFYKTSSDAIAATNGIYEQAKWGYWITFWYLSDIDTDDIIAAPRFGSDGHRFSNYTFDATEGGIYGVWGDMYQVINRANAVLDRVPAIQMDTVLRKRLLGEARFMRAFAYLNLVRFWGDVPLLVHQVTSLAELRPSRAPAAEVWAQIEADLTQAATDLPPSYPASDAGRPTSGAALTLLATAYLHQASQGVLADGYTKAAQAAGQVIASGEYTLLPNWRDNFKIATEMVNSESIFELNYDGTLDVGSVHNLFSLPAGFPGGDAYGLMQPTPEVVNLYAPGDERGNHGTIMISPYTDAEARTTSWSDPPGPAFAKWLDETNTQNMETRGWAQQNNNWIITRYADVLLMYAEAVNEGGTPIAGTTAEQALNLVRDRAGILTVSGLSQAAFRDSVRVERRREFVFEGHRWFDLSRWNMLDAAITAKTTMLQTLAGYTGETTVHGVPSNLMPIPQGEINLNPNLTQNPGW